jgi:hypothetical protein
VHPGRNNPPVGSGGALGAGEPGSWGALGASFYFNPIEVLENFCRVALESILLQLQRRYGLLDL